MLLSFAYLDFSAVLRLLVGRRRSEVAKDVSCSCCNINPPCSDGWDNRLLSLVGKRKVLVGVAGPLLIEQKTTWRRVLAVRGGASANLGDPDQLTSEEAGMDRYREQYSDPTRSRLRGADSRGETGR